MKFAISGVGGRKLEYGEILDATNAAGLPALTVIGKDPEVEISPESLDTVRESLATLGVELKPVDDSTNTPESSSPNAAVETPHPFDWLLDATDTELEQGQLRVAIAARAQMGLPRLEDVPAGQNAPPLRLAEFMARQKFSVRRSSGEGVLEMDDILRIAHAAGIGANDKLVGQTALPIIVNAGNVDKVRSSLEAIGFILEPIAEK